jgi:transglutaminase-like putative cysteine protease
VEGSRLNLSLRGLVRPLLYLVIFNLAPQLEFRPWWITGFSFLLVGFRLWIEIKGLRLPPRWTIWAMQAVVAVAIWQCYHSFFGDEAGGAFLTLLTCLKVYELKKLRDFYTTGILCLLVLMSYLLIDQGLTMAIFMLADVMAIMMFFYALQQERWSWKIWRESAKPTMALALKSLPLVVLMFVLFPRFNTGFGYSGKEVGKIGVSDSLHPGSVSSLIASDELIFRASFLDGEVPPRSQMYWRGAVLDQSHGLNWDRSVARGPRERWQSPPLNPDLEIYLEPGSEKFLFSPENTVSLGFPNSSNFRVRAREGKTFELSAPLQTRERYYIQRGETTHPLNEDLARFLSVGEAPSAQMREFLRPYENLPKNQVIRALLQNFHQGGFHYSLQPPPARSLDDFLFKTKIGFCEHFAGATATLLRYLKIPARVVVGFQGGSPSFFENYISVRGHDAHSWVEYYDQTSARWRRVDPTTEVEPLRVTQGSDLYFQEVKSLAPLWVPQGWLRTYLHARTFADEIDANWTGFLLRFDLARQKEILAKLGVEGALFRALFVFLLLSIGLILAVLYFLEAQRREPLTPDEKIYRRLLKTLKKWRIYKTPQEGPLALLAKIENLNPKLALQVEPILIRLIEARYGRGTLSAAHVKSLKSQIQKLR